MLSNQQKSENACTRCKRSHLKCNMVFPCLRCVKAGREATCVAYNPLLKTRRPNKKKRMRKAVTKQNMETAIQNTLYPEVAQYVTNRKRNRRSARAILVFPQKATSCSTMMLLMNQEENEILLPSANKTRVYFPLVFRQELPYRNLMYDVSLSAFTMSSNGGKKVSVKNLTSYFIRCAHLLHPDDLVSQFKILHKVLQTFTFMYEKTSVYQKSLPNDRDMANLVTSMESNKSHPIITMWSTYLDAFRLCYNAHLTRIRLNDPTNPVYRYGDYSILLDALPLEASVNLPLFLTDPVFVTRCILNMAGAHETRKDYYMVDFPEVISTLNENLNKELRHCPLWYQPMQDNYARFLNTSESIEDLETQLSMSIDNSSVSNGTVITTESLNRICIPTGPRTNSVRTTTTGMKTIPIQLQQQILPIVSIPSINTIVGTPQFLSVSTPVLTTNNSASEFPMLSENAFSNSTGSASVYSTFNESSVPVPNDDRPLTDYLNNDDYLSTSFFEQLQT